MTRNEKRRGYFREFKRQWRAKNRAKVRAANAVKRLKRKGLKMPNWCRFHFCGDVATEFHHPDYRKPNHVEGYCRRHHYAVHRKAA